MSPTSTAAVNPSIASAVVSVATSPRRPIVELAAVCDSRPSPQVGESDDVVCLPQRFEDGKAGGVGEEFERLVRFKFDRVCVLIDRVCVLIDRVCVLTGHTVSSSQTDPSVSGGART